MEALVLIYIVLFVWAFFKVNKKHGKKKSQHPFLVCGISNKK